MIKHDDVVERLQRFLNDLNASGRGLSRVVSEQTAMQSGMAPLYSFVRDLPMMHTRPSCQ
jgi:hypothetical protein